MLTLWNLLVPTPQISLLTIRDPLWSMLDINRNPLSSMRIFATETRSFPRRHMHAGLSATFVEAPSKLYAGAVGGALAMPQPHVDNCRTYASIATIAGAGSGYVAPVANVVMGADAS